MIERHLTMLSLVPAYPQKTTVAELLDKLTGLGFQVHQRSVERDLQKLSRFGLTNDEARPAGWSWVRTANPLNLAPLATDNALALILVQRYLSAVLPPQMLTTMDRQFDQAKRALDMLRDSPPGRWSRRVAVLGDGPPLTPPRVAPGVFTVIAQALLQQRQAQITYRNINEKTGRQHILHVLGLVHRNGTSYVIATAGDYDEPHNFALHRMSHPQLLDAESREPPGFSLEDYVHRQRSFEWPRGERVTLELRVEDWLARHLEEQPLGDGQEITACPTGGWHVRTSVDATEQLWWWLRSLGGSAEILGPPHLRERLSNELQELAARYKKR